MTVVPNLLMAALILAVPFTAGVVLFRDNGKWKPLGAVILVVTTLIFLLFLASVPVRFESISGFGSITSL